MFNLQGSEIIFILLLALVVLGPEKLPGAIRRFTRTYAELRKMGTSFQQEVKTAFDEPMREVRETADLIKQQVDVDALEAEHADAPGESASAEEAPPADDEPGDFAPPVAGSARPGPATAPDPLTGSARPGPATEPEPLAGPAASPGDVVPPPPPPTPRPTSSSIPTPPPPFSSSNGIPQPDLPAPQIDPASDEQRGAASE